MSVIEADNEPQSLELPESSQINPSSNLICPILIGIAGGSASGKTTLSQTIVSEIGYKNCLIISLDSFYKPLTEAEAIGFNFDHPDAFDFELCCEVIKKLLMRQSAEIPIYNFKTNNREEETEKVKPQELIILEGILALHHAELVSLMNLKLFVDCDSDIRLFRRVQRDVKERGRAVESILFQYNKFVKPAFDEFIKPSMLHANLIIPGRSDNQPAKNFLIQNLKLQLARLQKTKKGIENGVFFADVLDSCWLNLEKPDTPQSDWNKKKLDLHKSDRILFLKDSKERVECLQLFKSFSVNFLESEFMTIMEQFLDKAMNLMMKNKACNGEKIGLTYFLEHSGKEESIDRQNNKVIAVVVPFLWNDTLQATREKVEKLLESPNVTVFVISIFADLSALGVLSSGKQQIYLSNVLCIANMEEFMVQIKQNCDNKDFDFLTNQDFIDSLMRRCKRDSE